MDAVAKLLPSDRRVLRVSGFERPGMVGPLPGSRSAHLVGICGSGMQALAELLTGTGWSVSGSDERAVGGVIGSLGRVSGRSGAVAGIHRGHRGSHLPLNSDVLVYSRAIGAGNVERIRATSLGIPQFSYSQMLGRLMSDRVGVSIAGTHGKSTTTAMLAVLLESAGCSPSAVIGARLIDGSSSGWSGVGDLLVVESCEYRRSFLDLSPRHAVITGIEPDHFDCFASLGESTEAFGGFASSIEESGVLLVPAGCGASSRAARRSRARVKTFGRSRWSDWMASDVRSAGGGSRFRLLHRGEFVTGITVPVPGSHNVDNALAAVAMACELGVDPESVRDGMLAYGGLCRRFQIMDPMDRWPGVVLVDDYAHHPTAIRATLETARSTFGPGRLWCAFEPHQVSRTEALMDEFASSLSLADRVLVLPVFAAREQTDRVESVSCELADRVAWLQESGRGCWGSTARFVPSLDRLVATLDDETRPGDVLITMGAGDIDRIHHEFTC
jgi:UDP-N-acetylmuramate--alanine ligase